MASTSDLERGSPVRVPWHQTDDPESGGRRDWLPLILLLLGLATHFAHLLTAPPGVHGDSARLGLHALDFIQRGIWPFYIYHQAAPNPLIIYLQAAAFLIFGFTPAALRGVTAFWGALAVPATYLAGRELFAGEGEPFALRAGFLAAVGLALNPFFGTFSRYGIEPILLPALELLVVAALWRGLRRGRWVDFLLCGVLLGASQYAYIVARAFPLALAVACGIAILANRRLLARWRGLLLAAGSAALVALPQWLFFAQAPYTFVARTRGATQPLVFSLPNAGQVLIAKLARQFLMLGWRWDAGYHPGSTRPLLTPILFLGLLVAIGATFRTRRAGRAFALASAALMLAPDLLIYEGLSPAPNRVVPAVPFFCLAGGLGCTFLWRWLSARPHLPAWTALLVPAAVVLAGAESQWYLAARVLPEVEATPGLEWKNSLVEVAEAAYIADHLDQAILLPSSEYQRAPLAFLLAEHYPQRSSGVPLPLSPGEGVTLLAPAEPARPSTEGIPAGYRPDEWVLLEGGTAYFLPPISDAVAPSGEAQPLYASNGALAATVSAARWQGMAPAPLPASASFANGLDLVGYRAGAFPGEGPLAVTLYWQPRQRITADVQIYVQLLDRDGRKLAGIHDWPLREAYRVRAWQPGETMPLSYQLDVPPDLPPGPYRLIAGPYDLIHQQRVPLLDGQEFATVATLKVPLPPTTSVPDRALNAAFGEAIALTGYTLSPTPTGLDLALFWEARASPQTDYTVFVHLVDAAGQIAAQADGQPRGGAYPTSIWNAGETVLDQRSVAAPPGEYQVYVGLYQWQTLVRLPVALEGAAPADDRLLLGSVTVP
jgi:4-amino-4-deoxy-L-arabinose transferase-like glycosyltransferase